MTTHYFALHYFTSKRVNNKTVRTPAIMEVKLHTEGKQEGLPFIDLQYGFNSHFNNVTANDDGHVERYRMHSSIRPNDQQTLIDLKSGRQFGFEVELGFLTHTAYLIEKATGKKVAVCHFEDYYKD